jgi:hypothetical protein
VNFVNLVEVSHLKTKNNMMVHEVLNCIGNDK